MWTLWISKVAATLHPEDPRGPECGGQWRNNAASNSHPHIHSSLSYGSPQRAPRPRPASPCWDPRKQATSRLSTEPSRPDIWGRKWGWPDLPPTPRARARKGVFALSAHRYVVGAMRHMVVVRTPICGGSVIGERADNSPAHCRQQSPLAARRRVPA